ncbi:MAG TPA: thioredoxin-dependent thiol peroxidase [Polyangiaceae bacterium]|nr:thioredoxin-dependent thiol peroxidase [Polyangiaceae bacterium]
MKKVSKTASPKGSLSAKGKAGSPRSSGKPASNAGKRTAPLKVVPGKAAAEKSTSEKSTSPKGTAERTTGRKPATVTRLPAKLTSVGKKKASEPRAPSSKAAELTEVEALPGARVDVGDAAPSFVLKDDSQAVVSSEAFRGAPYVLYFYPKDDTPGCTLEACGFRDLMSRFSAKGVKIVGVSADSPESHQRFKKKYSLNFPLISDPEKTLAKAYGVWVKKKNYGREYMGIERSTFVIDRTGHIKHVFRSVRVPGHVEAVLDLV